ncbi:histidine phosphatase family protein [Fictibacillus iocasae]|uniref:Histidine phosphatase family protein n=1 Tax=Fictibacillus iocasae TaxID=2715437 RepID=A0ABW2NM16_9BACL
MIYVIRHGETDLNKERRMQGRFGLPLNEKGITQAYEIKENLQHIVFDYVFSSPQERAIQTAEIISGEKAMTDDRLEVFDLGQADRLKISETVMAGGIPDRVIYAGVENFESFVQRVFSFMRDLESNLLEKEANVSICGHRCTTGSIGVYVKGIPSDGNLLKYSSDTGGYKTYELVKKITCAAAGSFFTR